MSTSRPPHTWKHSVKRKCLPTLPILSHGRLKIRPSKTGFGKSNTFPFKKDILSETHTFYLGSFVLKNITLIITTCKMLSLPFSIVCVYTHTHTRACTGWGWGHRGQKRATGDLNWSHLIRGLDPNSDLLGREEVLLTI